MTIKATVFKLLWTSLSDLKNKRNICSIKKIITMYRWIKVWINKKYLFSLLFLKNTYHTFSHQRALVSVMSVLSFFFSECQYRRHRVKFKWCHTPLLRSILPVLFFIWFEIAIYQRLLKTQKWLNSVIENPSCNSSK